MEAFYLGMVLFLLLNMVLAMFRVLRGPTVADRLITGQLFGTTGVAILLLLAQKTEIPALRDIALVFAVLAVMVVFSFVRTASVRGDESKEDQR